MTSDTKRQHGMRTEILLEIARQQATDLADSGVNGTPNLINSLADTIEALQQRVGELERMCGRAEGILAGALEYWEATDYEGEAYAPPWVMEAQELLGPVAKALHQEPGEGGGGEVRHASDCAVHNAPALEPGPCDCGAEPHPAHPEQSRDHQHLGKGELRAQIQDDYARYGIEQPEQAQEGECPHKCKNGWVLDHRGYWTPPGGRAMDGRTEFWRPCKIHGTGRQEGDG